MDVSKYLSNLELTSNQQRRKDIQTILKILSKAINNPNEPKYRDINLRKLINLLNNDDSLLNLLYLSGFKRGDNESRLLLNVKHLNKAKDVHGKVMEYLTTLNKYCSKHHSNCDESKRNQIIDASIQQLVDSGLSVEEAKTAINISFQRDDMDITKHSAKITELIQDGYTEEEAIETIQLCSESYHYNAVDCNGSINECQYLLRLRDTVKSDINNIDTVQCLNDFNHLLFNHDSDEDFECIYTYFDECNITKCETMRRHHRNRNSQCKAHAIDCDDKETEIRFLSRIEIMDIIHCYFVHCYDIGCRLTSKHPTQINECKNDAMILYQNFANIESLSKFQQLHHTYGKDATRYQGYSFGQPFYYWPFFKHCKADDLSNPGYSYKDWYIEPKSQNLKQELMHNDFVVLTHEQWMVEYHLCLCYKDSDQAKSLTAFALPCGTGHACPSYNNTTVSNYSIAPCTPITLNHLIAIRVYCGFSVVSYEFSKTFRRLNKQNTEITPRNSCGTNVWHRFKDNDPDKESDISFKNRHRNFYYLAKYINEAVNAFSKTAMDGSAVTLYHGVSSEMLFDAMYCYMYQPLSTSSSRAIAIRFGGEGMILEMNCTPTERYFDCAWISPYPHEKELLFINPMDTMKIVNITPLTQSLNGIDFAQFIKAISVIDRATTAGLLFGDYTVIRNVALGMMKRETIQKHTMIKAMDPQLHGATPMDPTLKSLVIGLIKHKLNRCYPKEYSKLPHIKPYIDDLFWNVCSKKRYIRINWERMNMEMDTTIMTFGYQGYLFLKPLLFLQNCQMLNLDVVCTLFPNLSLIVLQALSVISRACLDHILSFISRNKCRTLEYVILIYSNAITNPIYDYSVIESLKPVFLDKGWRVSNKYNGKDCTQEIHFAKRIYKYTINNETIYSHSPRLLFRR